MLFFNSFLLWAPHYIIHQCRSVLNTSWLRLHLFPSSFRAAAHLYVRRHLLFMSFHSCFTNSAETSQYGETGCVVSSGSVCARATASTAPWQLPKKINLFVTGSSILRGLELMFYLSECCWIQCRWGTACMFCHTSRIELWNMKQIGVGVGGVQWQTSQCLLTLNVLCMLLYRQHPWTIHLYHFYNLRRTKCVVYLTKEIPQG